MRFCQHCGHAVSDEAGKFCSFCGQALTPAPAAPHAPAAPAQQPAHLKSRAKPASKKKILIPVIAGVSLLVAAIVFGLLVITHVICLSHKWQDATCEEPDTCTYCGKTRGEAVGHDWAKATCETPKTCRECGETKGDLAEHDWLPATCEKASYCRQCLETRGEPLGHEPGEWMVAEEPTLVSKGTRSCRCTVCGDILDVESIDMRRPDVDGTQFNFTDTELIDWINENTKLTVDHTEISEGRLGSATTMYPIFFNGQTGGLMLNHGSNGLDGNVCAIMIWFEDWEYSMAIAMSLGAAFDSDFSYDAASLAAVNGREYSAGGMTVMSMEAEEMDQVAILAPTKFLLELVS